MCIRDRNPTHVHYEVPVKSNSVLGGGFRQEVGMFVLRIYMRDVKLSILDMLSQNVGTHIDVFRAGVRHGVNSHLDRTLIILQTCMNGFSNQA